MDYEAYQKAYFVKPQPAPRYEYVGLNGISLYFNEYDAAVRYYERVLGPPVYVEGEGTRGWRIGDSWLTLFHSNEGDPHNVEVPFVMKTPAEADRLQRTIIEAGGMGDDPSDQLMCEPIRLCPVRDPFGTDILIICPLSGHSE
jgi:hypothetical protein